MNLPKEPHTSAGRLASTFRTLAALWVVLITASWFCSWYWLRDARDQNASSSPLAFTTIHGFLILAGLCGLRLGFTSVSRSIKARDEAAAAQSETDGRFRLLLDRVDTVAAQGYGPDGSVRFWNKASETLYGYRAEEALGRNLLDLIIPAEMRAGVRGAIKAMAESGQSIPSGELCLQRKDGSLVSVYSNHTIVETAGRGRELYCLDVDLTELKRAETELRESEARFRTVVESSKDAVFICIDRKFTYLNQAGLALFAADSAETLLDRPVLDRVHEKHWEDWLRAWTPRDASLDGSFPNEQVFLRLDGSAVPVETALAPIAYKGAQGVVVFARDITARRRSKEALRRRGEMLAAVCFAAERFLKVPAWRDVIEPVLARLGEAAKASRAVLFEARSAPDGETYITHSREWAAPGLDVRTGDPRLKDLPLRAGGFARWLDLLPRGEVVCGNTRDFPEAEKQVLLASDIRSIVVVAVVVDGAWWGFLAFDACEVEREWGSEEIEALRAAATILGEAIERQIADEALKRLTDQNRQSQKMEAVGQLAGGVAHDFNNILASTVLNLNLLLQRQDLPGQVRETLGDLETEAQRAANLTRQLLLFSRRSVMQVRPLNINRVVDNLLKMLRRVIGEQISLEWSGQPRIPFVSADSGMLEQVIMNLVVNARDSMPAGGRIRLSTEEVALDTAQAGIDPDARPGRFVSLTVADTGCAMDDGVMKRIFEPFFTTKEAGKGTGLGLATVYGIAKQHGGWVSAESKVAHGSIFRVYLPALQDPQPESAPKPESLLFKGGTETIMLVEDEPSVRKTLGTFLRGRGYHVLEAGDGPEALQIGLAKLLHIDLLITDMVLPHGMTGLQVADTLRASKPSLGVIIASGYSAELVCEEDLVAKGIAFLPKPCSASDLAAAVRRRLDRLPI